MKISELIRLLEKAKEEYGDVDVTTYDSKFDEWNDIEKVTIRGTNSNQHLEID